MKFEVPKIVRTLGLAEYAPEFGEAALQVWVNPPLSLLKRYDALMGEIGRVVVGDLKDAEDREAILRQLGDERMAWFAELWSQGDGETHWTVEEVRALVDETTETDPGLFQWMTAQSFRMIKEHRDNAKKA